MTERRSTGNVLILRPGWERQPIEVEALRPCARGGDRRKPPQPQWPPLERNGYSGQPIKAAKKRSKKPIGHRLPLLIFAARERIART